jgi:hypothetical protein
MRTFRLLRCEFAHLSRAALGSHSIRLAFLAHSVMKPISQGLLWFECYGWALIRYRFIAYDTPKLIHSYEAFSLKLTCKNKITLSEISNYIIQSLNMTNLDRCTRMCLLRLSKNLRRSLQYAKLVPFQNSCIKCVLLDIFILWLTSPWVIVIYISKSVKLLHFGCSKILHWQIMSFL